MPNPILVLLGEFPDDRAVIDRAAGEFGWRPVRAASYEQLEALCRGRDVIGTLVDFRTCRDAACLSEACLSSRPNGHRILPIVCTGVAGRLNPHELETLGAFDTLLLPLRYAEVRQALGFLAQAAGGRNEPVALASRIHQQQQQQQSEGSWFQ